MDHITGTKITIYEVAEIRKTILNHLEKKQPLEMDLGHVKECDTAGIQLLCSILHTARQEGQTITIRKFSRAITDAAKNIGIQFTTAA